MSNEIVIQRTIVVGLDVIPALLTIIGNIIFVYTLKRCPSLHTPSNVLLGALCISDLFVGIIVQPLFFANSLNNHACYLSDAVTIAYYYCYVLFSGFSLILAGFLSVDRYLAICYPFRYSRIASCKRYIIQIAIASILWVSATMTLIKGMYHFWFLFLVIEVIVVLMIIVCYARIYYEIVKLRKSVISVQAIVRQQTTAQDIAQKRERDKTRTIAVILGFFLVSYSLELFRSLHYLTMAEQEGCAADITLKLDLWTDFVILINSCVNPVVYCARSTDIRKAAVRLIRRHSSVIGTAENSRNSIKEG